jgi:hypothetical protein
MGRRCICEQSTESGPSTHRGTVHLSSCTHSTLRDDTGRRKRVKLRPVRGTRRVVVVDVDEGAV